MASVAEHLVGRGDALESLERILDEVGRGQPGAVEVSGEPGIGKSRLLMELAARAEARGHLVLSGAAAELERDLPFSVFVDAMDSYVAGLEPMEGRKIQFRIGIASGPLVAGVIGERKFSFDLWGDTVNTASRMESSGVPGRIQVTDETCRLLAGRYPFQRREGFEVKGKGVMSTWTLDPGAVNDA